ncbi:uncharacterized protein LOC144026265 [Festucalex cinctus]
MTRQETLGQRQSAARRCTLHGLISPLKKMMERILFWMMMSLTLVHQRRAVMSNYTLAQWPSELGPLHQGDPVHLLCSVIFDPRTAPCAGRHSVRWLKAGSSSGLVFVDGETNEECDRMSPKRCVYKLFINVSQSDSAIYYCALEACGNFVFANGTKLDLHEKMTPVDGSHKEILLLLSSILAFSLLVIALLINVIVKNNTASVSTQSKKPGDFPRHPTLNADKDSRLNSSVIFTMVESKTPDVAGRRRVRS